MTLHYDEDMTCACVQGCQVCATKVAQWPVKSSPKLDGNKSKEKKITLCVCSPPDKPFIFPKKNVPIVCVCVCVCPHLSLMAGFLKSVISGMIFLNCSILLLVKSTTSQCLS